MLPSATVATNPPLELDSRRSAARRATLSELLTTFHLASVVLDPYTNESAWILKTAARILEEFRGADVRVNFVVTADEAGAREFLGPLVERVPRLRRPRSGRSCAGSGLHELPAFVFHPRRRRGAGCRRGLGPVCVARRRRGDRRGHRLAARRDIPEPGDPGRFRGTPALSA